MIKPKRAGPPSRRYFVPYFVLVVGLLSTLLFSYYVWRTAQAKDLERFNTTSQELVTYVRGRPRLYIEVLRAATGLFAVSSSINPGQFEKFVERLELADQYPGVQGIGYLVRGVIGEPVVKGKPEKKHIIGHEGLRPCSCTSSPASTRDHS